jgi:predicted deacetylase
MSIHVSIHDVSPLWEREVDVALEMCRAVGAKPALLVVPNFHGKAPLNAAPKYARKLRRLQDDGHEIILHGLFHESRREDAEVLGEGRPTGLRWHYAQKIASGGEAEFSDVSEKEADLRLDEGEAILATSGLTATGFIPPAWSMPPWLLPKLGARGYTFCEDHLYAYDPANGIRQTSVVLNYASRTPGRLFSSVAWCRVAKYARVAWPARIAIHPADMRFALLRHEVESLLAWGRGDFVESSRGLFTRRAA